MSPERIEELLQPCGPAWLGGQRKLIVQAMKAATEEEHLKSVKRITCTCDMCLSVMQMIEAERLA